jgi:hypothetical protein
MIIIIDFRDFNTMIPLASILNLNSQESQYGKLAMLIHILYIHYIYSVSYSYIRCYLVIISYIVPHNIKRNGNVRP